MWRLAHRSAPLEYVPWRFLRWHHRFDDPGHQYRTLYAAVEKLTCLREVLGDLAPNAKALAEFEKYFGPTPPGLVLAGEVSWQWRRENVLARGVLELKGDLIDLDEVTVRRRLEKKHAALLDSYGMRHLSISEIRSEQRPVTQQIGRSLYEEGAAGVLYRSNRDDRPCVALFEGAARLVPTGEMYLMTEDLPELLQVCSEYDLVLRRS